jgi:hypothetical protein
MVGISFGGVTSDGTLWWRELYLVSASPPKRQLFQGKESARGKTAGFPLAKRRAAVLRKNRARGTPRKRFADRRAKMNGVVF